LRRGIAPTALVLALWLFSGGLAGLAGAQVPGLPDDANQTQENLTRVSIDVDPAMQEVARLGQVRFNLHIQDISGDEPGRAALAHYIYLDLEVNQTVSQGWTAFLGSSFFLTRGGDSVESFLVVQAPATVKSVYFQARIVARMQASTGDVTDDTTVIVRILPFSLANVDVQVAPPSLGPLEDTVIPVYLENAGLYPDTFTVEATGPEGWLVVAQHRLTLFPGESTNVPVFVQTPATRVFVPQETGIITIKVRSTSDPDLVYERSAVVILQGFFLPDYWLPLMALGAVLAVSVGARAREAQRRRALEQGKPRRGKVTPVQAVLLKDLKARDPERYTAISGKQRRLQQARERAFSSTRDRRERVELMLVEQQRQAAREAKLEEEARLKVLQEKERELERRRAIIERDRQREEAARLAQERRVAQAQEREAARLARLEAPNRRREEREKIARQRKLQAELRAKQRQLHADQRKQVVEMERRRRLLERRKREMERRAGRGAPKPSKPGKVRKRGRGGQGEESGQGDQGPPPT
jgi:hypothetical protein